MENNSLNRLFQTAGEQKKQQGTGFTNLNRIMSANQNNQLGQKVAGNIQNQIGNVKSSLQSQQQQFQTEAERNRLDTEQNKQERQAVLGRFTSPSSSVQDVNEDEIKKFQQFRTGTYAGPQGLKDTASLGSTAQELASQTSNLSPSGTSELLRRSVGGGRYTQGQQKLDTLLMDRSKLQGAARQAGSLSAEIARASGAAQAQAEQYKNLAKQFATETEQQLQSGVSSIDEQVQAELTAAQAAEQDRLNRIKAIQDFAANRRAKVDASGNVVKDQYGNIQYDTGIRGSEDKYVQMDNLANLLRQQGVSDEEISKLTGVGSFAQGQQQLNKAISRGKLERIIDVYAKWAGQYGSAGDLFNTFKKYGYDPKTTEYKGDTEYDQIAAKRNFQINHGKIVEELYRVFNANPDLDFESIIPKTDKYGDPAAGLNQTLAQTDLAGYGLDQQRANEAKQRFYGSRGILGGALSKGSNLDQVYTGIANALANSQSAQNLTKAGVASDPLRTSYSALEKLLGKKESELTIRPDAERYQAGKFQIDPELIRRML